MINFIGVGGAFTIELSNCSAYYRYNEDSMILIDCGENIFERILKFHLLDNIKKLNIIITHFHSDHVGSLGSLLFYCNKIGINNVNVIYPDKDRLTSLIEIFGVQKAGALLFTPDEVEDFEITPYKQEHSHMESFGYLIKINGKTIYYSGDTKIIPETILNRFLKEEIDYFYQDVRLDENDYHISLKELKELIPSHLRKKVYCMHFSSTEEMNVVGSNDFKLVKRMMNNGNTKPSK